jgi:hypothetical protein
LLAGGYFAGDVGLNDRKFCIHLQGRPVSSAPDRTSPIPSPDNYRHGVETLDVVDRGQNAAPGMLGRLQ